eukprot:CAMPEP_0183734548 /NCGR_PEP_ID=MMETSP0737-20130205/44088_1 /TAXON_ID=385413 /ORGANISM="Thalassiosira miniscula, Strain CCMP1093" /LENGTH=76 /DNA_ID=CAMNT_0025968053 /DNA_START=7 /DNA_END=233 /DNA_ORIENTATION=+
MTSSLEEVAAAVNTALSAVNAVGDSDNSIHREERTIASSVDSSAKEEEAAEDVDTNNDAVATADSAIKEASSVATT